MDRVLGGTGLALAVAGAAGLAFGLTQVAAGWAEVRRAEGWPVVPGEVVEARLDSGRDPTARWGDGWEYRPVVVFRYAAGGVDYTGRQAWLGAQPGFAEEDPARGVLAAFPVGATVEVRHDPDDPARAALVLRVDRTRGMILVAGRGGVSGAGDVPAHGGTAAALTVAAAGHAP